MSPPTNDLQDPLTPQEFHILLALLDEEKHGYAIMREVADRTAGRTRLGPGTLYGAVKRMLREGWIEEAPERPDPSIDDQRRKYYRVMPIGRRVAAAEADRLAELLRAALAKRLVRGRIKLEPYPE